MIYAVNGQSWWICTASAEKHAREIMQDHIRTLARSINNFAIRCFVCVQSSRWVWGTIVVELPLMWVFYHLIPF